MYKINKCNYYNLDIDQKYLSNSNNDEMDLNRKNEYRFDTIAVIRAVSRAHPSGE